MARSEEKRVSPIATWSLTLGVLGIGCLWIFGAIPAIILGFIALSKIVEQDSKLTGRDRAIAGIATGILGLFIGLFSMGIWAAILLPEPEPSMQSRVDVQKEKTEMAEIHTAIQSYSIVEGTFPARLEILVPLFLPSRDLITTRNPETSKDVLYRYRPEAFGEPDPSSAAVLLTPGPLEGEHRVLFADGRMETTSDAEILSLFHWRLYQAKISLTTRPCTSVRRKSRPAKR